MEERTDVHSHCLLYDIVSFTILDLIAYFIFSTIMRWIENKLENRSLFLCAWPFRILLFYSLEKSCPKYITLILSYIYLFICKSVLLKSILKIFFFSFTKNRGKFVFSILACLLVTSSFPKIVFSLVARNRGKVVCSISACLLIITSSFLKIFVSLVVRNRVKVVCCILILACLLISSSFLLESSAFSLIHMGLNCIPTSFNYYYLKSLAYIGIFIPQSDSSSCPVENPQENRMNVSQRDNEIDVKEMSITRVDLKNVMQDVCQFTEEEEDIADYMLDYQEFFALFEDTEPSLDEIWEAFSIFDQDGDGFFDTRDLHRVLINLGLQGGMNLNTCQHMIELYDRDGDGKINSSDFCRILESSLLTVVKEREL